MITDWDDDWDDYWDGQLIMHTGWKPNLRFVRLLLGWDEVGWGGLITLIYTCAHASRYPTVGSLALAHMRRATLFSCTCTHASRYAAAGSLALAHMRRAMSRYAILLHLHACVTLRCCRFSCTCTHASRYARLLHLHACVTLRCCRFSCTCTHASRYARLLHLHACVMLRCCRFSCTCTKKNNPDWMTWFGDMFAHGNGAGKQMLLDLSFKIIRSLHCQDLNFTGKTRWRCGFGHEGWRKGSFFDMQFIQNMQ